MKETEFKSFGDYLAKCFFLKIESFFVPKRIDIYHILCIFSVDYNVVEVNNLVHIFAEKLEKYFQVYWSVRLFW